MSNSNQIIQGDCINVLSSLADESIDLILTDPPYLVNYRDRTGRTIAGDHAGSNILQSFADLYRVLKPDSFCISFYGWTNIDKFFSAWTGAGFVPAGHIVFQKDYASSARYLQYRHEQAYLLIKGRPQLPQQPLSDVRPWEYSGNRAHPTEKAVGILEPLIRSFSSPGDIVLDPFAGSGSTLVAAALSRRAYVGIELEGRYCEVAQRRLAGVAKYRKRRR
jgi:site-specific DNA-methyltransferase (adenine-specific)